MSTGTLNAKWPELRIHLQTRIAVHGARLDELNSLRVKETSRTFYKRRHEVLILLDREKIKAEAALCELEAIKQLYEQNI